MCVPRVCPLLGQRAVSSVLISQPLAFCSGMVTRHRQKHQLSPLSLWCFLWDVFQVRVGACATACSQSTESIWARIIQQSALCGSQGRSRVCAGAGKRSGVGAALRHPSFAQTEQRESA